MLDALGFGSKRLSGSLTIILTHRGSTESAAFSEHLIAKADLAITVPDNLTFEEAATLGVGISTVVSCAIVELSSLKLCICDTVNTDPLMGKKRDKGFISF